jgi:hypothetical protein
MNAFSGFGKKIGSFWDLAMNKRTAAPFSLDGAVISKFGIYSPVQQIIRVDNSAIPEYTIIRGANMGVNVPELWESYFPPVVFGCIEDESENNLYALLKDFIFYRDGICLLDIKGMAKVQLSKSIFPSENDPANEYWPKLEKELEKGKPVKIIEFFLEEDSKVFKLKYEERVKRQLPLLNVSLPDEFIKENNTNKNWTYYDNEEDIFKYKCSNILGMPSPNFNSIYAAFRCYVPRYYADSYLGKRNHNEHKNIRKAIKNAIESYKLNETYFIPTHDEFIELVEKLINYNIDKDDDFNYLKFLDKNSAEYKGSGSWWYYKNKFYNILLSLNMRKKAEDFERAAKDGVGSLVEFISELIKDPRIRERIDIDDLNKKIRNHYKYQKSLHDNVKGKDGKTRSRIDFHKDENNYDMIENEGTFPDLSCLTDNKLDILRNKWRDPFIKAFEKNKYAQGGQANFATNKTFRRFIDWLLPYIDISRLIGAEEGTKENAQKHDAEAYLFSAHFLYTKYLDIKEQKVQHEDQLLLESELFKDYCRAHGLNGCKECAMVTHDISECKTCIKFKNEIYLLKPLHEIFIKKINRFFELLVKDNKNKFLGEYDD